MMMMMMSTFIALDSINLNAQCVLVKWGDGKGRELESHKKDPQKDTWCKVQSHSQNRCVFRRLRNAAKETASLIVCGRALQSLGAE